MLKRESEALEIEFLSAPLGITSVNFVSKIGLNKLYQTNFQESIQSVDNPYDGGETSTQIINTLNEYSLENILKKHFYDV